MRNLLLETFLETAPMTEAEFAAAVGCSRTAVRRYIAGDRVPEPRIMDRIAVITGGAVPPDSWTPLLVAKHRARGRPWSVDDITKPGDAA